MELAWLRKGLGYSVAHSKTMLALCGVLLLFGILSFVFLLCFLSFGGRVCVSALLHNKLFARIGKQEAGELVNANTLKDKSYKNHL